MKPSFMKQKVLTWSQTQLDLFCESKSKSFSEVSDIGNNNGAVSSFVAQKGCTAGKVISITTVVTPDRSDIYQSILNRTMS